MKIPIILNDSAIQEIKKLFQVKGMNNEIGLRIGVKGAGCSGNSFVIGFDEILPDDIVFEDFNFKIYIQKKDFIHLSGITIDFLDSNDKRGFAFNEL